MAHEPTQPAHVPCGEAALDGQLPSLARTPRRGPSEALILGADWNLLHQPDEDGSIGQGFDFRTYGAASYLEHYLISDWYRLWSPEGRESSRCRDDHAARRIDSIWGSPAWVEHLQTVPFRSLSSDHRAVEYAYQLLGGSAAVEADLKLGPGPWRLHPGVLEQPDFCRNMAKWRQESAASFPPGPSSWSDFHEGLRRTAFNLICPVGHLLQGLVASTQAWRDKLAALDVADASWRAKASGYTAALQHSLRQRFVAGSVHGHTLRPEGMVEDDERDVDPHVYAAVRALNAEGIAAVPHLDHLAAMAETHDRSAIFIKAFLKGLLLTGVTAIGHAFSNAWAKAITVHVPPALVAADGQAPSNSRLDVEGEFLATCGLCRGEPPAHRLPPRPQRPRAFRARGTHRHRGIRRPLHSVFPAS